MKSTHLHEYNFVLGKRVKDCLKNLTIFKESKSLSSTIVKIMSLLLPVIKMQHKWGKQRNSHYLPVSNDPDEIRENVHAYFPWGLYKQMKLIHQDLNSFSIAQLVRDLLRFFLVMVEFYGDDVFKVLNSVYHHWEEENKKTRLIEYEFVRQLWLLSLHFPDNNGMITIYDSNFLPFRIFRL